MSELEYLILFSVLFLTLLGIAELLFRYFKYETEFTRKFAHFSTALVSLFIPYYIKSHLSVLALTLLFFILLIVGKQINLFRSIESVHRKTLGSYLFPLSIYTCFLFSSYFDQKSFFIIPILVLAISDTLAAIIGKQSNSKIIHHRFVKDKKTIAGSSAFFVSTFIIVLVSLPYFYNYGLSYLVIYAIILAIVGTLVEMISRNGFDNLLVPFSLVITLLLLL